MLSEKLKKQIINKLKKINLNKIILFGSYTSSYQHKDSDIDILVVTNDEFIPQNFKEKNELYLKVSNTITDIEKKIPIDLIVHTKAMYEKFIKLESMFSKKIVREGIVLYENHD